jgi:hypothetical protein
MLSHVVEAIAVGDAVRLFPPLAIDVPDAVA